MTKEYTMAERRKLLERIFELFDRYEAADKGTDSEKALMKAMEEELGILCDDYLEGIPETSVSRCPYTGKLLKLPVDTQGLDGLWWNSDSPLRPVWERPETFLALDGSLLLQGEPEQAPFIAMPGPDRPFVVPRILACKQVKAVVSSFRVGAHTAYAVSYFADPPLYGVNLVNEWGTEGGWIKDAPGLPGDWRSMVTSQDDRDFDLAAWIKKGKLMWIFPGDRAMTLHSHLSQCPYLELPGDDRPKFIEDGTVWRMDVAAAEPPEQFDAEQFLKLVAELEGGKE